jgi:hypothetical protein
LGYPVLLADSVLLVMMKIVSPPSPKTKNPPTIQRISELPWDVVASLLFSFLVS